MWIGQLGADKYKTWFGMASCAESIPDLQTSSFPFRLSPTFSDTTKLLVENRKMHTPYRLWYAVFMWHAKLQRTLSAYTTDDSPLVMLKESGAMALQERFEIMPLHEEALFLYPKFKRMNKLLLLQKIYCRHPTCLPVFRDVIAHMHPIFKYSTTIKHWRWVARHLAVRGFSTRKHLKWWQRSGQI